jgi:hypothetical protein
LSKEDKHIDNLFQEKLSDRSFDGPPADFLADLDQRLDAKPVVSKSWIWMIFLNFFIIGLFIANASIDSSTPKTAEVEPPIENKEQHSSKEESFKSESEQKKSTTLNTDDTKITNTTENERLNSTEVKSAELETNQVEKNLASAEGFDSTNQANVDINNESIKESKNENIEDSSKNNSSESDKTSNTSPDSNNEVSIQVSKEAKDSGTRQEEKAAEGNEVEAKTKKTTSDKGRTSINSSESISSYVSYSAIYAPEFNEVDKKIKTSDFPEFPSRWNELVADKSIESNEKAPKKEEDTGDKRMFEIQLQGGATKWNYKTLGTNDNYVSQIDDSGTSLWTPNFGLGLNANFNNISVGTGINYTKFKTENAFEFSEINTYDSTYIGGYNENVTYDSLGNPVDTTYIPYYDSTTVTDTTYNITQITNEYEWIQIPLHIGYRFNLNKWAIIPRLGVNIGVGIRKSSGQYPNEAYTNLQTIDPVKWNLNLHTSLEVRRDFGYWHAFGKFNYQRNLTPTIDNALFERKFNGIGFNFGIGYSF